MDSSCMKKILSIVSNCLVCVLIFILLMLLFINFSSSDKSPFKFGNYSLLDVNGVSMNPVIKEGDLIAIDRRIKDKYEVDDVISFYSVKEGNVIVVTHKIETVIDDNGFKYITKGVNNDYQDKNIVKHAEIIGEYKGFRIPLIGYVVNFSRTTIGYWLLVVLPLGLVFVFVIYELIKEVEKKKGEV